jgi:pilus assembly protein CpaE
MQRVKIEAFLQADDTASALEGALADPRLSRARLAMRSGGIPAAVEHYAATATPDILVVECREPGEALTAALAALAAVCQPTTKVVVLGAANDVVLYRALRRQGVSEYLPLPAEARMLGETLAGLVSAEDGARGRLISFIGAGGGVGSSQIAHHTAFHLARLFDSDTAVIDLDLGFGTVGLDFNIESAQSVAALLAEPERLDESLMQRLMARHGDNLYLLTAAPTLAAVGQPRPEAVETLLGAVRHNAAFTIADLPCMWLPWVESVLGISDEIVVTATPRLASLRNAKQIIEAIAARRLGDTPIRVVVNHVGAHPRTELAAKDFVTALDRAPTLLLRHDPAAFETASNNGQIIGDAVRSPKLAELFERLALAVSGRHKLEKRPAGLAERLRLPLQKLGLDRAAA